MNTSSRHDAIRPPSPADRVRDRARDGWRRPETHPRRSPSGQRVFHFPIPLALLLFVAPRADGADAAASLKGRANVLLSAYETKAFVISPDGKRRKAPRLNDGNVSGASAETLAKLPAVLQLNMLKTKLVRTVRIFSGNADYAPYPSGEMAATAFKIEGMLPAATDHWFELASVKNAPGLAQSGAAKNEDFVTVVTIDPVEVMGLRVTILGSNDTGRRTNPDARPKPGVVIREVELYTHEVVTKIREQLSNMIESEFRLPVYRDQETAQLHVVVSQDHPQGIEVVITVRERHTGRVPAGPRRVTLRRGETRIDFAIKAWENGEYRVELRAVGDRAAVGGSVARLLRINRLDPRAPPADPETFTGRKMFFPDARYLASRERADIRPVKPGLHQASRPFLKPGKAWQHGNVIGFLPDGKLAIRFVDNDRDRSRGSAENHYAVADPANLSEWQVHAGIPAGMDSTPSSLQQHAARLGSRAIRPPGKNRRFRFYDAGKDGPVQLAGLRVHDTGYKPDDWGVMEAPARTAWLLWEKDDVYLILRKKPFLRDGLSADEFEDPFNSNDNFAGQWLSPDGKTFVYVRGRLLKRYPPFVARYDNIWQAARMLTVFTTQDGLNWDQRYMAPPDEQDGPTEQHYGARIYGVPDGGGLMISYTLMYNAVRQQMHTELFHSWDGMAWHRSPGHAQWTPRGKPGDWNFGAISHNIPVVERDGMMYHLISWASATPHFGGTYAHSTEKITWLDGTFLEKRYGERGLAQWPYFDHYGSYENLAQAIKQQGMTCGVVAHRKNGWWALTVGATEGAFQTRAVVAKGATTINARIGDKGHIHIVLLDTDGTPIKGYSTRIETGDGTDLPVFDSLPASAFRVSATMRNAELFTLNF
jgi:hypothetical protein